MPIKRNKLRLRRRKKTNDLKSLYIFYKMRNVALYGGAFDPPHIGHLSLIHSLFKTKGVDEIWLLPCGDREDKKLLLPMHKRLHLMQLLFGSTPNIKISDD